MTQMFCDGLSPQGYGGYNAHPGGAPYIVHVPFEQAIKDPPVCRTHDRPYLTLGGYRMSKVVARIRSTGRVEVECDIDYGLEGYVHCRAHDSHAVERDGRCTHQRLAALIARRHEMADA